MNRPRPTLAVRKALLLHQLHRKLDGYYIAGAMCTSDTLLLTIAQRVATTAHNIRRVERVVVALPVETPGAGPFAVLRQLLKRVLGGRLMVQLGVPGKGTWRRADF